VAGTSVRRSERRTTSGSSCRISSRRDATPMTAEHVGVAQLCRSTSQDGGKSLKAGRPRLQRMWTLRPPPPPPCKLVEISGLPGQPPSKQHGSSHSQKAKIGSRNLRPNGKAQPPRPSITIRFPDIQTFLVEDKVSTTSSHGTHETINVDEFGAIYRQVKRPVDFQARQSAEDASIPRVVSTRGRLA
jgi:hypothetical protein